MRAVYLWVFAVSLLAPLSVRAQMSAEEMVSDCKAIASAPVNGDEITLPQDFKTGVCWGAFLSFQQSIRYVSNVNVDGSKSKFYRRLLGVCAPENASPSQHIKVFLAYAARHPEELNKTFFQVVLKANKEAFPCGN